jgi:hypothetical protein
MEIVIDLAMLSYLGLLLAVPLVMLGFFLHRVRILKEDWRPILARCVIAIGVWVALSFLMMYVNFLFIYGAAHTPPQSRGALAPMLILLALTIGYGLAGWGLCYWVKGRDGNGEENQTLSRVA